LKKGKYSLQDNMGHGIKQKGSNLVCPGPFRGRGYKTLYGRN
jgi:hypothetical protein